jgi:membrane-associated phospholipid phosphatase
MNDALSATARRPSKNILVAANVLSTVGHPLVLLPLTIALSLLGRLSGTRLFVVVAVFLASTVIPMLFIIRRKVATGVWTDMDVSDHGQRGGLYNVAIPIILISIVVFWLFEFPRGMIIGASVSLVLMLAGMAINRFSKISMHAMFGAYCVVILLSPNLGVGLATALLVAGMSWSRVALGRHTVAQVIAGNVLGAVAGGLLIVLLKR